VVKKNLAGESRALFARKEHPEGTLESLDGKSRAPAKESEPTRREGERLTSFRKASTVSQSSRDGSSGRDGGWLVICHENLRAGRKGAAQEKEQHRCDLLQKKHRPYSKDVLTLFSDPLKKGRNTLTAGGRGANKSLGKGGRSSRFLTVYGRGARRRERSHITWGFPFRVKGTAPKGLILEGGPGETVLGKNSLMKGGTPRVLNLRLHQRRFEKKALTKEIS